MPRKLVVIRAYQIKLPAKLQYHRLDSFYLCMQCQEGKNRKGWNNDDVRVGTMKKTGLINHGFRRLSTFQAFHYPTILKLPKAKIPGRLDNNGVRTVKKPILWTLFLYTPCTSGSTGYPMCSPGSSSSATRTQAMTRLHSQTPPSTIL